MAQAHGIGARAVPVLLPFLGHDDAGVRSDIAFAFAPYSSMAATIAPALQKALAAESNEETRHVMETVLATLVEGPASQEMEGEP